MFLWVWKSQNKLDNILMSFFILSKIISSVYHWRMMEKSWTFFWFLCIDAFFYCLIWFDSFCGILMSEREKLYSFFRFIFSAHTKMEMERMEYLTLLCIWTNKYSFQLSILYWIERKYIVERERRSKLCTSHIREREIRRPVQQYTKKREYSQNYSHFDDDWSCV